MATGRFAPSPTGDLHLGNLRTALVAWLLARHAGSEFGMRMEDLDRAQASLDHERRQLRDLAALGLDWDGPVVRQSDRLERYEEAIAQLVNAGLTYPCYCSRREIREASAAPHHGDLPDGAYPGTCLELSTGERRLRERNGRPAALRLRGPGTVLEVVDDLIGPVRSLVDDVVLRRNDGTPAYNLAVVVDDAAQGIEQVVRADDLASSSPRQRYLASLLGLPPVRYAHVPLVLAPSGDRLAKRDGAVTLDDQLTAGRSAAEVCGLLAQSLGQTESSDGVLATDLVTGFDPAALPSKPWTLDQSVI